MNSCDRIFGRAGAVVAVFAVLALGGCTPPDLPITALRNVEGKPVLVIADCPGFSAHSISVIEEEPAGQKWRAAALDGGIAGATELALLSVPPQWTVSDNSLTGFEEGVKYAVMVYTDSARSSAPVGFTLDQVKQLQPGQLLMEQPAGESKVVSEKDFRKIAAESCD